MVGWAGPEGPDGPWAPGGRSRPGCPAHAPHGGAHTRACLFFQQARLHCPATLQEKERVAPERERVEDAITAARREVAKLKRRLDEVVDRSFAAFSK